MWPRINHKLLIFSLLFLLTGGLLSSIAQQVESSPEWGFFGHRRINRMAVFTLPIEMMPFFRANLEYLTEHAVDPDKRRYATRHEAVRHYIDIDHWGVYPFEDVPRNWTEALLRYGELTLVPTTGEDTMSLKVSSIVRSSSTDTVLLQVNHPDLPLFISLQDYKAFWDTYILPQYYEDEWPLPTEETAVLLGLRPGSIQAAFAEDHFSEYGIVPYHLEAMQRRLTRAFRSKDARAILRFCAEMGHYVGDGHVPLHTTENYNGALTDQVGIHAFWESRLPELFADDSYDYFVGKAEYVRDKNTYFWDVVLDSHQLLDSVLLIEKRMSETIPPDRQYCFEERLGRSIRTQCEEYARAYHEAMDGMVERRMREAILSIGSVWFTAWVDAGQPDLNALLDEEASEEELEAQEQLNRQFQAGENKGREHGSR
ncbi:MAG: zinc dependent phospholipase C family protein [Bacteroidota bacterium]